jgi:hypothetical protein
LATLLASSCGGGNGTPQATSGTVSGTLTVGGPINGASDLQVGLFAPGSTTATLTTAAGHVTSAAGGTATITGRNVAYSFTEVPFGTYNVGLYYASGATPTFLYRSSDIVVNAANPARTNQNGTGSFTGSGPFGTISGVTQVAGTWPDSSQLVFIGFAPQTAPQNVFQWLVSADDLNEGYLYYNVDNIAYGTYYVGLYGYNPVTHAVSVFGQLDNTVTINAGTPDIAGANFGSDFAGDPGTDPALGSISGEITLNAELPANLYIYVAANTIPPQQGAPPAAIRVKQADVVDGKLSYELPFLGDGQYSVSIFSYDINTHQAIYFGEVASPVTISGAQDVTGVNFTADVTLL